MLNCFFYDIPAATWRSSKPRYSRCVWLCWWLLQRLCWLDYMLSRVASVGALCVTVTGSAAEQPHLRMQGDIWKMQGDIWKMWRWASHHHPLLSAIRQTTLSRTDLQQYRLLPSYSHYGPRDVYCCVIVCVNCVLFLGKISKSV